MSVFRCYITPDGMEKALEAVKGIKDGANTAMARALNRTIHKMRTESIKAVRAELPLKAGEIRETMGIKQASKHSLEAWLSSRGPELPLIRFRPIPQEAQNPGPPGGVSVITRKSQGRQQIAGSFVANMKSGHKGVFKRGGKSRLPIFEEFGPAIPDILNEEPTHTDIERTADAQLRKRLTHEIEYLLSKAAQ